MFIRVQDSDTLVNTDHIIKIRSACEPIIVDGKKDVCWPIIAELTDNTEIYLAVSDTSDQCVNRLECLRRFLKTYEIE